MAPRKPKKSAKAGTTGAPEATGKAKTVPGRQSTWPGKDGTPTPADGGDCAGGQSTKGGNNISPEKPEPGQVLREISLAELHMEIVRRGHVDLAATLKRLDDFRREIEKPGFPEAVLRWQLAFVNDLIRRCGQSVARGWMRGPENGLAILLDEFARQWYESGRTNLDEARYWIEAKGGGKWQIANPVTEDEWVTGFMALLRNPVVPRALTLQLNALTVYYAAKFGNVRFFERVSEVFRKRERRNMKAAGGSAGDMILLFWIPAGLWTLNVPKGCARLNEIILRVKASGLTDHASQLVMTMVGEILKKTYAKAKERLGL